MSFCWSGEGTTRREHEGQICVNAEKRLSLFFFFGVLKRTQRKGGGLVWAEVNDKKRMLDSSGWSSGLIQCESEAVRPKDWTI